MAGCRSVHQYVTAGPGRQERTKPGITEIQFRCFDHALQFIIEVGLQQENDSHRLENFDPFFCRRTGNTCGVSQIIIVDQLSGKRGTGP